MILYFMSDSDISGLWMKLSSCSHFFLNLSNLEDFYLGNF